MMPRPLEELAPCSIVQLFAGPFDQGFLPLKPVGERWEIGWLVGLVAMFFEGCSSWDSRTRIFSGEITWERTDSHVRSK